MRPEAVLKRRLEAVRRALKRHGLGALLVTRGANVAYLTGFSGSAGAVLVSSDALHLMVDFRYFAQASTEAGHCQLLHVAGARYAEAVAEAARQTGVSAVAFEADALSVAELMALEGVLKGVQLVPSRGLVEQAREVKDASEQALIRRAAAITSAAVDEAAALLGPGLTERELAGEVECQFRRLGGDGLAFETLVAFGDRSALPHPRPSDRALRPGEWVLIDAGCRVGGYCADMTRAYVLGVPSSRQRAAWDAVRCALERGLAAVRPGARASDVDAACRSALAARGWEAHFGHDTGHGVGLEIHEGPRLAADAEDVLEPGMVVTVEPGVYVPGWGGCRLEELALVTETGVEVLTDAALSLTPLCALEF